MKRFIGALAGVVMLGGSVTGVAQAATPSVVTGAATNITTSSAVLHGQVDPHGQGTTYAFAYGITPSYGSGTTAVSAGSGERAVAVVTRVTGLLPGTTYHFQIVATNPSGSAAGADATFTTKGVPPSAVATGPTVNVGKTVATPTGTVTPNGADTGWVVQYGTTINYGLETFLQTLAAGTTAEPVAFQITGLAPATLFHYRIVAYHGAIATYGADQTFFTEPDSPPSAGLRTNTTPASDATSPYTFTTSGSLTGGHYIPAAQRCNGTVGIRYYNGAHQLAFAVADVASDCTFSTQVSFKKTDGKGSVRLRVSIFYRGDGYLAAESKVDHPHAGK